MFIFSTGERQDSHAQYSWRAFSLMSETQKLGEIVNFSHVVLENKSVAIPRLILTAIQYVACNDIFAIVSSFFQR
jgi:hypothetical protein